MPSQLEETTRECPVEAFQLLGAAVEFASDGDAAGDDAAVPITMLARSSKPIFHWYWGKIAHDLSGMSRKPSVPVDWLHRDSEVIGFVDSDKITRKGLEVSGALVPYPADPADRASEIAFRGKRGVPYEASINFRGDGVVLEKVGNGASVQVNGYKFEGPGIVVRKWPLRGIAICPHGVDANTETKFSEDEGDTKTVSVRIFKSEETMSVETKPDGQADEPLTKKGFLAALSSAFGFGDTAADSDAGDPPAEPEAAQLTDAGARTEEKPSEPTAAELKAELKHFSEVFGDEGPKLFAEELSFDEAAVRVIGQLRDKNADLEKRLSAVNRGDTEGAQFEAPEDDDPVAKRTRELSSKMDEKAARRAALVAKHRGQVK